MQIFLERLALSDICTGNEWLSFGCAAFTIPLRVRARRVAADLIHLLPRSLAQASHPLDMNPILARLSLLKPGMGANNR